MTEINTNRPVLVIGGAGKFAGLVTAALTARGTPVRALVRSDDGAERARALGAKETVIGTLLNRDSVAAAAEGAAAIFHICPAFLPEEAQVGWMMIDIARRAGIDRFVYCSALHPVASRMINHDVKRQVEERLIESGLNYTILQPARFMQGVILGWDRVLSEGVFAEPFSAESKMAFVDFADVAEVAAICLTQSGYDRAVFELSAEGMLDRHQIVALMSAQLGRPIRAETVPVETWTKYIPAQPYLLDGLRRMTDFYDQIGFPGGNSLVLRTILGRPAGDYASFLAKHVAQRV